MRRLYGDPDLSKGTLMNSLARKLIVAAALALAPAASFAGVFISVGFAPPVLPVYTQPICPGEGFLWNPGYWAYGPAGYYWVPGVWVRPPQVGVLWTPPYWGWSGGAYVFRAGFWGPHVGYYGGINYGFGFGGVGFVGGRWDGGHFAYNTAVVNVDRTVIHNTYIQNTTINNTVINNNHTSFNGGTGGIQARPSAQEAQFQNERHIQPTSEQQQHFQAAAIDRGNLASANGGHPQLAAARTANEYHAVAQQHAAAQPITPRDRAQNQQQRIGNGVRSGQLNAGETRNLEGREASINHQAIADRAANGGRLNQQERQQINQRQNNVSRSINQDKHNAAQQPRPQTRPENRPAPESHPNEAHPRER